MIDWHTIPIDIDQECTDYGGFALFTVIGEAVKAVDAQVDFTTVDHIVVITPKYAACPFSGIATMGNWLVKTGEGDLIIDQVWLNDSLRNTPVFVQELGHNLGLFHANAYQCGDAVIGPSCYSREYGDGFDSMGAPTKAYHFNAVYKEQLGWLKPANVVELRLPQDSGLYRLVPLENPSTDPITLKILKDVYLDGSQEWYYVEYRRPVGFDAPLSSAYPQIIKGGLVHLRHSSTAFESQLLDMTPQSLPDNITTFYFDDDFSDAALAAGKTFTDPSGVVGLTTVSQDTQQLFMQVTVADDLTGPKVQIVEPQPDAKVTGLTLIRVQAADRSGVAEVSLYKDGALYGVDNAAPYCFGWDTTQESGQHSFTAKAKSNISTERSTAKTKMTIDQDPADIQIQGVSDHQVLSGTMTFTAIAGPGVQGMRFALVNPKDCKQKFLGPMRITPPYTEQFNTMTFDNGSYVLLAYERYTAKTSPILHVEILNDRPVNQPPIANAGADQVVNEGDLVTLDGSGSFDPDPADTLSYSWSQTSGPAVSLSNPTAALTSFTAPQVTGSTSLSFSLTVSDGSLSATDEVGVAVNDVAPPSQNILLNPGFESGKTSWGGWGTGESVTSGAAYEGTSKAQLTLGGGKRLVFQLISGIVAGKRYECAAAMKTAITTGSAQVSVEWRKAGGALIRTDACGTAAGPTSWEVKTSPALTAPSLAAKAKIILTADVGSGTAYFDAVSLKETQ